MHMDHGHFNDTNLIDTKKTVKCAVWMIKLITNILLTSQLQQQILTTTFFKYVAFYSQIAPLFLSLIISNDKKDNSNE